MWSKSPFSTRSQATEKDFPTRREKKTPPPGFEDGSKKKERVIPETRFVRCDGVKKGEGGKSCREKKKKKNTATETQRQKKTVLNCFRKKNLGSNEKVPPIKTGTFPQSGKTYA